MSTQHPTPLTPARVIVGERPDGRTRGPAWRLSGGTPIVAEEPTPTVALSDAELTDATAHYLVTALWSSNDDDADPEGHGHPLDRDHDTDDVADEFVAQATDDVRTFAALAGAEDVRAYLEFFRGDAGQLGHDLWLTRNGHGVGFWDRGLPGELGDRLTTWADTLGEVYPYVGDDGLIYADE